MAKFVEIPLEILKKLILLIDKETNRNLLISCRKFNSIGYSNIIINNFIDSYLKPLESLPIVLDSNSDKNYKENIYSFFKYIIKYKPCIQYAKKKYILLYNSILLNNPDFFHFVCNNISFYPSSVCFNSLNLATKTGLSEVFDFFCTHMDLVIFDNVNLTSFITEKDNFNFFLNACQGGHLNVIKKLVSLENTVLKRNDKIITVFNKINIAAHSNIAFDTACENGHKDVVSYLINNKNMRNIKSWNNAMTKAINNHHLDVALVLILELNKNNENGKELLSDSVRNCGFRMAVQNKNCPLVEAFLVNASSITKINWSFAIKNALINEHTELLSILLNNSSKLENKNEIINSNILNSIMKLVKKKSDYKLQQILNKINNKQQSNYIISGYQDSNEIIDKALKEMNSCIAIENLFYILILNLNNKPFPLDYQNLSDSFKMNNYISERKSNKYRSYSSFFSSSTFSSLPNMDRNLNSNKHVNTSIHEDINNTYQMNGALNKEISIKEFIGSKKTFDNFTDSEIQKLKCNIKRENIKESNSVQNFQNNIMNNNLDSINQDSTFLLKSASFNINKINWMELINEENKIELSQEIWNKCIKLSIREHRYNFLYYLLYSYNKEFTGFLSIKTWNKIISEILRSFQINLFKKICNIKRDDILLSSENINLLIKAIIHQNEKKEEILLKLTDQEISFLSKENYNLLLCYTVENNIDLFVERLLQFRYKDLITKENKEYCLKTFVYSKNIKLFKLLLLQDKSICTTKNRNFVYNNGNQEMKCFMNSF